MKLVREYPEPMVSIEPTCHECQEFHGLDEEELGCIVEQLPIDLSWDGWSICDVCFVEYFGHWFYGHRTVGGITQHLNMCVDCRDTYDNVIVEYGEVESNG